MKTKHKATRLKNGTYNYRGFGIEKDEHGVWVLRNEDGGPFKARRTLRAMKNYIDQNYRKLSQA
jgi:hypothetical protein